MSPEPDFFVSSEPHLLDHTWIVNAILGSYWGGWRNHDLIVESIRNSLCFGLYHKNYADTEGGPVGYVNKQVGFLRAITDYATFTEIADVFIDPAFRRQGLGRFLVFTATHDPRIFKTVIHLGTRDAGEFYMRLGFQPATNRMKKIPKN